MHEWTAVNLSKSRQLAKPVAKIQIPSLSNFAVNHCEYSPEQLVQSP